MALAPLFSSPSPARGERSKPPAPCNPVPGLQSVAPTALQGSVPVQLGALARVVRSKNAGPTQLTLDLFFHETAGYERAAASAALHADAVAGLYGLAAGEVRRFELPALPALKFTLPRRVVAGSPGDGDVYGAQQHGPLLGVEI